VLGALNDPAAEVRRAALETLADVLPEMRQPDRLDARVAAARAALEPLATDPDVGVQARAASLLGRSGRRSLLEMANSTDAPTALAALAVLGTDQAEVLVRRAGDPLPEVRTAALQRLSQVARPVPLDIEALAGGLRHPQPSVRRATVRALGTVDTAEARMLLASALGDPVREVRMGAADELGAAGEAGLLAAEAYLHADASATVEAALHSMASSGSARARQLLTEAFQDRVREAWQSLLALHVLPEEGDLSLRFLRAALDDSATRCRQLAFRILEMLEDTSVLRSVEKVLRIESARSRADALEILSNLGEREAASLLVLMLEEGPMEDRISTVTSTIPLPAGPDVILEQARASGDRWLRMAAAGAGTGTGESDVREEKMERLLILRRVPLFAQMTLEQLDAINRLVKEVQYLAGETIIREGDVGSELFLLVEGEVQIFKNWGTPQQILLATCRGIDYFGEMAILDDEPRSATVAVTRDARLLSLQGDRLKELVLQMPEIAFKIFRVLTQRVRAGDQRLQKMMQPPPAAASEDPEPTGCSRSVS